MSIAIVGCGRFLAKGQPKVEINRLLCGGLIEADRPLIDPFFLALRGDAPVDRTTCVLVVDRS